MMRYLHKILLFLSLVFPLNGMAQSLEIVQHFKMDEYATVLTTYKNEFGHRQKKGIDDSFPFAVLEVNLEGDERSVTLAKEKITLNLGTQYMVEGLTKEYNNKIVFLISSRLHNVYMECGDGCKDLVVFEGMQLKPDRIYYGTVRYTPGQLDNKAGILESMIYDSNVKQKLIIQVDPYNAKFELNGMALDINNKGRYEQTVSLGVYSLSFEAERYRPKKIQVVVNDSTKPTILDIKMKPAFGWLRISGEPADKVYANGKELNVDANKEIELMSGQYKLLFEKQLYKPYEHIIEMTDSSVVEITPNFIPNFRELAFHVHNDAEIWIDNKKVGVGNYNGKIEYGTHLIQCKLTNHRTTEMSLTVDEQTLGPIILESPSPIFSSLIASSSPDGAEIYVDDELIGKTPGTYPITIGKHKVSIKKSGYTTDVRTVDIVESENYVYDAQLTNIVPIAISVEPKNAAVYIDAKEIYGYGSNTIYRKVLAGEHLVELKATGFQNVKKKIHVTDTNRTFIFKMKKKYYYDSHFYFGAYANTGLKDLSTGGYIGGYIKNFNIEAHCLYGPMSLAQVYWNSVQGVELPLKCTYRPLTAGGRLGYGVTIGSRVRITPQVGCDYIRASSKERNDYCTAISVAGGLKTSVAIASCFELMLIPQYSYPVYMSDMYKSLSEISPVIDSWSKGFSIKLGLGLFF